MNIALHYIQFTVYVAISTELNLGFNKEWTIVVKCLIIAHNKVYGMKAPAIFSALCCLNSL